MAINWEQDTGYKRTHDLPGERKPVKPQPQKKSERGSTGYTSQVAGIMTDDIMQRAMQDRLALAEKEEAEAGDLGEDAGAAEEEEERPADRAVVDDDDDLEALRARRRQQMKEKFEKDKEHAKLGHGSYDEIVEEEFLKTVTSSKRCVVHFYHKSFERCKIVDMHMQKCARKFFGTRFVKLNSEKAPFFVAKLQIKTLPCCVVFFDGVATGRQLGFNGLPNGDEFKTAELAWVFKGYGGIEEDFGQDDDIE